MFWNKYFIPSFLVMLVVAAFHWLGALQDYYSKVLWYDIPMHFMGGVWVALFTLWVVSTQYGSYFKKYLGIRNLILFVFVFGFAWEILELILRFNSISDVGYTFDTVKDLIIDMLGAGMVVCIYKKSIGNNL